MDGDNLRLGLNSDLGFQTRSLDIHGAEVARLFNEAGIIVLSAYFSASDLVKLKVIGVDNFIEVFCSLPSKYVENDVGDFMRKLEKVYYFTGLILLSSLPSNPI